MRFWRLKDGSAVESHADHVDISDIADEITKKEWDAFFDELAKTPPVVAPTIEERIRAEVLKMKDEGLIH